MNRIRNEKNDVNGTGTSCEGASSGRCSVGEQRRTGRNQVTARMKWTKEMNIAVMECFYSAKPFDGLVPKEGLSAEDVQSMEGKRCEKMVG